MRSQVLIERLVALIRDTSSSLPDDVLKAIRTAKRREQAGGSAAVVLDTILRNCAIASKRGTPLCQDTGMLTFFVNEALRRTVTRAVIEGAVRIATERGYLRRNCIDAVTNVSYDDNVGFGTPVIHYTGEVPDNSVTLLLKGGGSENMSRQYSLPDAALQAGRDLEGVRKCVLDAVRRAKGYGCAPGILGVCIGGDRATGFEVAKQQLLRPLDEKSNRGDTLVKCEADWLKEANSLNIGPMGLGGKTTLLGLKIAARPRLPASFFVTVAYMCWACRRRTEVLV